jgi:hypothetical protein
VLKRKPSKHVDSKTVTIVTTTTTTTTLDISDAAASDTHTRLPGDDTPTTTAQRKQVCACVHDRV